MNSTDDHLNSEQDFFGSERRQNRTERKLAQRTDRSKYRKSDQDQARKQETPSSLLNHAFRGRIIEIRAGDLFVQCQTSPVDQQQINRIHTCHIKGRFKSIRSRVKNLVAVGDWVHYLMENEQEGLVFHIEPRRTVLSRADNLNHVKEQILAANVDLLVIVFSLCQPTISTALIDRYLIAAQKGGLDPILVITKLDLLEDSNLSPSFREAERTKLELCKITYASIGIPLITFRQDKLETLEPLKTQLKDKVAVFSGSSGVGKSSIINLLSGTELRTQSVCLKTGRGTHTTSHSQFIPLHSGGWCVDTPGIRSFALWQLDHQSINQYFKEFSSLTDQCKFRNCSHKNEPGCAIHSAVEQGLVAAHRYDSYISLLDDLEAKHLRR